MSLSLPPIKLERGLHMMHLFYRVDRVRWAQLSAAEAGQARGRLENLCAAHAARSHPRLATCANVGPFFVNLRLSPAQLWEHLRL